MATDFELSIDGNLPNLAAGNRLTIYVDVNNITNTQKTGQFELMVGGDSVDTIDTTLDSNDPTELVFGWEVPSISSPETRTIEVVSANDSTGTRKIVLRPYGDAIRARWRDKHQEDYVDSVEDIGPTT